jgi:hypothetical protein
MDIYILRSDKEVGPLSEVTVQTLLKQGSILLTDPAWRPGMAQWSPLHSVLYPAASPARVQRPPVPDALVSAGSMPPAASARQPVSTGPVPQTRITSHATGLPDVASAVPVVPASAKQKAFLSFMGIAFAPDLTKDQAAVLTQEVTQAPKEPQRLALWNAERLRLHPDLFAEEIQAKKDSRASVFLRVIQTEGAEFFSKVTKAHCQVLVGALDVRFPGWDSGDPEKAAWKYVFPALAGKFPQLVASSAKGIFSFPVQPSVVSRQTVRVRMDTPKAPPKRNPLGAVFRGLIWGGVVLAVLYFSQDHLQPWRDRIQHWIAQAQGKAPEPTPVSSKPPVAATEPKQGAAKNKAGNAADASAPSPQGEPVKKSAGKKAPASQPVPAVESAPAMAPVEAPTAMAAAEPPTAVAAVEAPTAMAPVEPPTAAPKSALVLTKPAEVQVAFGKVILQPGTQLKFVASEGANVRVVYGKDVLVLPASSTDYVAPAGASAAPAKPAVSTNSLF